MPRFIHPLEQVRVAAPCAADWERMRGNDCVRFCDHCNLNVYNLSAMSRREAEQLITRAEDRLCVRFYRRADGTILTQNCPVGLHALKRRVSKIAGAIFAAVTSLLVSTGVTIIPKSNSLAVQSALVVVEEDSACMGTCSTMISPYGEQCEAGAILAGGLFLFGYPLLKLRERQEAKRRAELHVWRRS